MDILEKDYDVQALAEYCDLVLDLKNTRLSDEYFYQSLPLCVLDAVFSIGVRYEGTRQTVVRYCDYFQLQRIRKDGAIVPPHSTQEPIPTFLRKIGNLGIEKLTNEILRNHQRTSSKSGILKSEAVLQFAEVLKRHGVEYIQDVNKVLIDEDFERGIRSIPGQGSGISLRYFFMLSGSEDLIKPDRHIKNFIREAIGKEINEDAAQRLLHDVCMILRAKHKHLTPRLLDNTIWKYQRIRGKTRKKNHTKIREHSRLENSICTPPETVKNGITRLTGRIIGTGTYYSDDAERLEIRLYKNQPYSLPLKLGIRVNVRLIIGESQYDAGAHITSNNIPWISADLYNAEGEKVRLVYALAKNGFSKGEQIYLDLKDKSIQVKRYLHPKINFKTHKDLHTTKPDSMGSGRHKGNIRLSNSFHEAWKYLDKHGDTFLNTSAGTEYKALSRITRDGQHVIRFLQNNREYGRAYECCWGHYHNCHGIRIGMYCVALDDYMKK